jgi:serine/threonine-protein kinase
MTELLRDRLTSVLQHQYQIEDEIGRGGMSVVYRARDLRLQRMVAIKVLPPELAHDPALVSRFTREAQTSAQLAHSHIVPIYDVGERDGIAYFVMALITGGNLAQRLEHHAQRPIDEVRRLLCETADALAYAHLRGVIHRDIKADNILIDADSGRAMVTDFGIARAMEGGTRLTQTGVAVGTPTYMSPEQAMGERQLDGRSDIYSLGVLGYQMITGRVPFTASNSMALLLKHVSEKPQPIAELRPETPKALCDAIERALKKSPEERWSTASAFRDALMLNDEPSNAWRSEQREPVRYSSPIPRGKRSDSPVPRSRSSSQQSGISTPRSISGAIELEPPHLASLTAEQRADLRLWHGRVNLLDRVKHMRRYALVTLGMWMLGMVGFAYGVGNAPPLVLSPLVPIFMSRQLWRRGKSLRVAGLRLRRVFFSRRSRLAIAAVPLPSERQLQKLVPLVVLESPHGSAVRRAAEDRAAILDIVKKLSKEDRAMVPELVTTVNALVDRVANLAQMLYALDDSVDRFPEQHAALARQLEGAALALANLRRDLIKLRSSGAESSLGALSNATQEARALSRDIGVALEAAAEVRAL